MDPLLQRLRAILGPDGLLSEPDELLVYECDGLPQHKFPPRAVCFPRSTAEVAEVVRALAEAGVSYAPRGAGTGLSGGALARDRGVIIELARMRRILKLDAENRLAVVESGLVNAHLSRAAAPLGLHYAPDPSSQATCTVGGNIAENAGGIHCLKYGTTVDHVLAARVVLSDGSIVDLGGEEAVGYDLLGLFIGSEGTFGIATEATLRLTPIPPAVRTLLADFLDVNQASRAVSAIIAAGLIPAALEMVDGSTIRAVEASVFAAGMPTDAEAALLIELDGLPAGLDEEADRAAAICLEYGARTVRRAADDAERKRLWAARKGAFGAMGRISPDIMLQDAVVPRSRLPEVLSETYRIAARHQLKIANVFHAGDGNLHPFICFDSRDPDQVKHVKEAGREMMEVCVRAGGTLTGEHGVGLDKSDYLPLIFSADDMEAMLRVRTAFDPTGLCNPGKILPTPRTCGEARPVLKREKREEIEEGAAAGAAVMMPTRPVPRARVSRSNLFDPVIAYTRLARALGAPSLVQTAEHLRVAPQTVAEAQEVMRLAVSEGWPVIPAGAATWLGPVKPEAGLILQSTHLHHLLEHEPADLVATCEAGLGLTDLNRMIGDAGQWLPLDPPDDGRATVGGVAATGLGGAQSLAYGLPRGYVIGLRALLADGRLIRAGGKVVKNVAGYDLCKLFVGSYGTLGLITELTFKLRPRPAAAGTLRLVAARADQLFEISRQITARQLLPAAMEVFSPGAAESLGLPPSPARHTLLVRFAGTTEAVRAQLAVACETAKEAGLVTLPEPLDHDADLWRAVAALPYRHADRLIFRVAVRQTSLPRVLMALVDFQRAAESDLFWQAGAHQVRVYAASTGRTGRLGHAFGALRTSLAGFGGALIIENAPPELADDFGGDTRERGPAAQVMRRLKDELDPDWLMNAGRVPF